MQFANSTLLLKNAQENSLYDGLVSQLRKDFGLANIQVNLPDGILPNDLLASIREKIYYLFMERFPEYLNLLYIVDVPEREFKGIKLTDVVEVIDQVTYLVLARELQKVCLKKKYGN